MIPIRFRIALVPMVATFLLATFALLLTAHAGTGLDDAPVTEHGLAAWWRSGALAAPMAAVTFGLLVVLERLSTTRLPGLAWLRRGSVRSYLSMAVGSLGLLLPTVADGSVTWGGLSVALLGGMVALRPGGGEAKQTESVPT